MRSTGEKLARWLTGVLTFAVFAVLYAPVFISVLFSMVEIRKGEILWETFSLMPYRTLWSNPSVISAPKDLFFASFL